MNTNIAKNIMTLCAWNIRRGFDSKHSEITDFLQGKRVDIAALLELDIKNVCTKKPPALEGFTTMYRRLELPRVE